MTIEEIFEQELFKGGYDVISDFLGYNYPENEDKEVTSNRIRQRIEELPVEAFDEAFKQVVKGIVAYDIKWNIDMSDVLKQLDEMSAKTASEALDIPYHIYANMSTDERHNFAYDRFHHNYCDKAEFMGIPEEILIPKELVDEEDISEWLTNEKEYCHEGFRLKALE